MSKLGARIKQLENRVDMTQHQQILEAARIFPPLPSEAAGFRRFLFSEECSAADVADFDKWFTRVDALSLLDKMRPPTDALDNYWIKDVATMILDGTATQENIQRLWPKQAEGIMALVKKIEKPGQNAKLYKTI